MEKAPNLRCCMCPKQDWTSRICPGIPGTQHPAPTPCRFVNWYSDNRGWIYFVRSGIGGDTFKIFYQKPGKNEHAWRPSQWRKSFDEAQTELNTIAERNAWQRIK